MIRIVRSRVVMVASRMATMVVSDRTGRRASLKVVGMGSSVCQAAGVVVHVREVMGGRRVRQMLLLLLLMLEKQRRRSSECVQIRASSDCGGDV